MTPLSYVRHGGAVTAVLHVIMCFGRYLITRLGPLSQDNTSIPSLVQQTFTYEFPPVRLGSTNPISQGANKIPHRLARRLPRRLATVPLDNIAQRALIFPSDFLSSILIDGPFGGLGASERFVRHQDELDEQPGYVQSYAPHLL